MKSFLVEEEFVSAQWDGEDVRLFIECDINEFIENRLPVPMIVYVSPEAYDALRSPVSETSAANKDACGVIDVRVDGTLAGPAYRRWEW